MKKIYAKLFVLLIITTFIFQQSSADKSESNYVSHPGNIPEFKNYITPQISHGKDGTFNFSIKNRYDKTITDVALTVEIYRWAIISTSKDIESVKNPPIIKESGNQYITFELNKIGINETIPIKFIIQTSSNTNKGTYFIRCLLNFKYNNTEYKMKSRGFFSNELWDDATENATKDDPGNINLTYLDCNGIIPDSSFGVKNQVPRWPRYLLIFLVIFLPIGITIVVVLIFFKERKSKSNLNPTFHESQQQFSNQQNYLIQQTPQFQYTEQFCPYCKAQIQHEMAFCIRCGKQIKR